MEKVQNLPEVGNGNQFIIKNISVKKKAMSEEYKLKKNFKLRKIIKLNHR